MKMGGNVRVDRERRWALFATLESNVSEFAEAVRSAGPDWKPVTVAPERLKTAVRAIQPRVVVIDARVPGHQALCREVQADCPDQTLFIGQQDLPRLSRLVRTGRS